MIFTRRFGALRARQTFSNIPVTDVEEFEVLIKAENEAELAKIQVKPHDTVRAHVGEKGQQKHAA